MGVPSFYRWLVEKYPNVVQDAERARQNPFLEFDNLYIDMNAIIHPCFHPEDERNQNIPLPTTFEDVFRNVFQYVDRLVQMVRPRKLLYMAIDGVAPRAKMNQQRARRFQSARDKEILEAEEERLRKQFELEGKQVLPKQESQISDSNIITPGTEFMHKLSMALREYISSKLTCEWNNIMVILSDANVPGEGEHKIMSYIRNQRSLHGYDPNSTHCIFGSDADLIMLALATHEPHFSILREDVPNYHQQKLAANPFTFLHTWLLREYLELDMKIEDPPKNFVFDIERIIDDFIFMCFFAGNDFLPHMPSLEIHEGAIDLLLTVYKKEFNELGGYLVDMSRIGEKNAAFVKLSRVEKFILMVGSYEEKILKKRSEIREQKLRRLVRDSEDAPNQQKRTAPFHSESELFHESSDCALQIKKASSTNCFSVPASSAEILQNTKELQDELKKCIREKSDLFKSGELFIDKIKLGMPGFKERYYKVKFCIEGHDDMECKRKEVVQKYTEGLLWVLEYYYSGVASWTWFYSLHYGPFASDLKGMGQVRVNFEKGVPFLPLDQLLSVLPPGSAHALPKAYAQLMLDEHSKIIDLFPQEFDIDMDGKRFMWQCVCKVPWIDESRLLAETKGLRDKISENESTRNSVKVDSLFVGSTSKLAQKICSCSPETYPSGKFDTKISDGIGGLVSLCHESVMKPCLRKETCDNEKDLVLCLCYELSAASNHVPRLLSGVKIPDKTIFEGEIMETELWHERQRYGRFERVTSYDKRRSDSKSSSNANTRYTRTFSSDTPGEVIYKGAGVGWGAGRGNGSNTSNMKRIDAVAKDSLPYLPRSQHFVDGFRQFKISDSNNLARPSDSSNVWTRNNGYMNQSKNVPCHGSQSEAMRSGFDRGSGRIQNGSHSANSWRSVSCSTNSSSRTQWNGAGAKGYQVKDQNRW